MPAFSFVLIALYSLLQYHRKNEVKWFYVAMTLFAFAGLIKISSMIAFVFMFFILTLELFKFKTLGNRSLFRSKSYELISFVAVVLIVLSWYMYASYYNAIHGLKYTINDIYLPGKMDAEQLEQLIKGIKNLTGRLFFNRSIIYSLFVIGVINLFLPRKIPPLAYLSNIIIILGGSIYSVLWLPILRNHDYYFTAILILFIGILVPFTWFLKATYPSLFKDNRIKSLLSVFLIFNFLYCLSVVKVMTSRQHPYMKYHHPFLMHNLTWANNRNIIDKRNEKMRPYLRQLGIAKEDKVITLPDYTPNVSLYFMGQKGWSDFFAISTSQDIDELIDRGAKYLIVTSDEVLEQEFLKPFLSNQIGSFDGIRIFKLSSGM